MKVYLKSKSNNYIVTIAIGKIYLNNWKEFALPTWKKYCLKHDIGLIVFTKELISKEDPKWKKPTWQKLLLGIKLSELKLIIKNVCYMDTDFLINYVNAPNIFKFYNPKTIGVVSMHKNINCSIDYALKSVAFNRKKFVDSNFPLNSALHLNIEEKFKFDNLKVFNDFFCAGLFLFNIKNHSKILNNWFNKYDSKIVTMTGGDQPLMNYEILNYNKITWLDYKFHTIWLYEIGYKYPFLLHKKNNSKKEIINCIEASLMSCYFLHFAGSWIESNMWKNKNILLSKEKNKYYREFSIYLSKKIKPKNYGKISAKK